MNRKNFYEQPINSDRKQHEAIKKLATRQCEDYSS